MSTQTRAERGVTVTRVDDDLVVGRGARIKARREAMSWSKRAFAERARLSRNTLDQIEEDDPTVRATSYSTAERALDELAEELGFDKRESSNVVRFVVKGVYGAESLVVEGPVESIAELERSVDRIMRRLRETDHDS